MTKNGAHRRRWITAVGTLLCVAFALLLLAGVPRSVARDVNDPLPQLELPGFAQWILARVTPSAHVEDEDVPVVASDRLAVAVDHAHTDADLQYLRKVVITIHDYEDAVETIESIPPSGKELLTFGTFVISDEAKAGIENIINIWADQYRTCGFLLLDLETGAGLYYNIDDYFFSASCFKAIYLSAISSAYPDVWSRYYSYMRSAIVNSNNECYVAIFRSYPEDARNLWRKRAHLEELEDEEPVHDVTVRELAQLWCVTWDYLNQEGEGPATMREWLTDTYQSAFSEQLGSRAGYESYSKAGWTWGYGPSSSEGGFVVSPGGTYLLIIMTDRSGSPGVVLAPMVRALNGAYQAYAPQKAMK